MSDIFTRVTVKVSPENKSKLIEWSINPRFVPAAGVYNFYIEQAYSTDSWTRINSTAIVNQDFYVDATEYRYGILNTTYYRVVLEDSTQSYISTPVNISGYLPWREYKIVRNILRQEYTKLKQQGAGIPGYLLRRRHWGQPCATCDDYDMIGIPVKTKCAVCYGTGIVGGYYNAYPYYLAIYPGKSDNMDTTPPVGLTGAAPRSGAGIAFPEVHAGDIWISDNTDERFYMGRVVTPVEIQEQPVLHNFIMFKLPVDRIEYQIPLQVSAESSAGTTNAISQSWREASEIPF